MVYIIIYVEVEVLRRRYFHVETGNITLNPPRESEKKMEEERKKD